MEQAVKDYLDKMVAASRIAQQEFATYPQETVDKAVRTVGKAVYDNAELLAHMAVDETKMGNYADKIAKCVNKSKSVWWRMGDWGPSTVRC